MMTKLVSKDGQEFTVNVEMMCEFSKTVNDLMESCDDKEVIPLSDVDGKTLTKILQYCQHHFENKEDPLPEDPNKSRLVSIDYPWNVEFCNVPQEELFELILASNYLNMQSLLDLTCNVVASMIRGKSPEEIRTQFNIKNDFTPEEYEAVKKENEWCSEQ
jgi:S-phase kinase-associated protein 1